MSQYIETTKFQRPKVLNFLLLKTVHSLWIDPRERKREQSERGGTFWAGVQFSRDSIRAFF